MAYTLKRRVSYKASTASLSYSLPAIFTERGLLISHLRYLHSKRAKSPSWMERNAFAVELLLKFIGHQASNFSSATELLRTFVEALQFGTIQDGEDQSGLFWHPRTNEDVNVLLHHITDYCDYLDSVHGTDLPKLNPLRKSTFAEERLQWCAYYRRQSCCFLNHLTQPTGNQFSLTRTIRGPERHFVDIEAVYRFPEEHIDTLIANGFTSRTGTTDYGSQLIVMLMHYGGLRLSECFHIYTDDISIDPKTGSSLVSVFHPSDGISPDKRFSNRREFLAYSLKMAPRNEYPRSHRLYSGWKKPMILANSLSFDVNFYPPSKAVEFTLILQKHLSIRPETDCPYLFVNSKGDPESKRNFIQKHFRAINRIGLNVSKSLGTTSHAHRHAYGYRLSENGFSQLEIQKAMHHKSPESCLVYLRPSSDDVRNHMRGHKL